MKKAFTLTELLIIIAIIAILAAMLAGFAGGCSKAEGSRAGIVSKLSYKGIAFKSWEGELMLGKGESANVWQFSVIDPKVVEALQGALRSGNRVELSYRQQLLPPVKRSTHYTIIKVTVLDQQQPQRKLEK